MNKEIRYSFESFGSTINMLKEAAEREGVVVTDADIIRVSGVTDQQFRQYSKKDRAPAEVFKRLRAEYEPYMKYIIENIVFIESFPDPLWLEEEEKRKNRT